MHPQVVIENAEKLAKEFDVRLTNVEDPISTLSGGNQQKTILARELSRPVKVLVAAQPTRGLDVGSIEFVHNRIIEERDRGAAVLVVSTELDEVRSLADRIAVMYRGQIVGIVPADTKRDTLGLMMAGVPYEEALAATKGAPQEYSGDGADPIDVAIDSGPEVPEESLEKPSAAKSTATKSTKEAGK